MPPSVSTPEVTRAEQYGHRTLAYLRDLLSFADELSEVVVDEGQQRFLERRVLQLAAEALLQKLGEAANRLPEEFREDHSQIPWRAIRGMRNLVAHEYHAVDYDLVWSTAVEHVPFLAAEVRRILGE